MARPKGTKYIKTPEKMWELFMGYVKETKNNPVLVHDFVGRDGESVRRERERPLTMEGFEMYVCNHTEITYPDLGHYFANTDNKYEDYFTICSRIRRRIRQDQIEGGMAGIYNPSITQRLNGLVDKQEQRQIIEQPMFDDNEEDE